MLILKGIHATTAYHAQNILQHGLNFPNDNQGKAGSGLYFWHYQNNAKNALKLSKQWWEFAKQKGLYDSIQDCNLVQFDCEIKVEAEALLDFVADLALQEAFLEAYPIGQFTEKSYGAKLDDFIHHLENISKINYKIIRLNLSVPNLRNVPFANAFPALIIKKPVDIKLNKIS